MLLYTLFNVHHVHIIIYMYAPHNFCIHISSLYSIYLFPLQGYVQDLVDEVFHLRNQFPTYKLASQNVAQRGECDVPSIARKYDKPEKVKLIQEHCTRFNK